jgi:DNA-binding NarL/FixJ family response regulator
MERAKAMVQNNKNRRKLTAREQEVLKHLVNGYTNEETADLIKISRRTVEAHRSRIMLKLGIQDLAGLVKYSIRTGLISVKEHRSYC